MTLLALGLCGACSLRSLDYLEEGSSGAGGLGASGGDRTDGGKSTGGSASAGKATNTSGSANTGGVVVSDAGRPSSAGEAGMPPEEPDCKDGVATVDETDLDCGGRTCSPCKADAKCVIGSDCESAICTNQRCQSPTCTDLALNGSETDVNCGGGCPACAQGRHCAKNADCASGSCQEAVCVTASCRDDVLQDGCPLLADNTPYAFSASHATDRCIDDNKQSVADGNAMVLFKCKTEVHQTFWAIAQADGYFALRSALSGKCLHVRDASNADGAAVEQRSCTLAPEQLWKPTRVDSSLMQLTAKHSGLVLDVAGDRVDADLQGIVQSNAGNASDKLWHAQKRASAAFLTLAPYDDQTIRVHHAESTATLTNDDASSAHWKVVPGLSDVSAISFQSRDEPGRYLRHASFRIWADNNDGSNTFKKDASFRYASPFVGTKAMSRALESVNYPGYFWLRDSDVIRLSAAATSDDYKNGATWWLAGR